MFTQVFPIGYKLVPVIYLYWGRDAQTVYLLNLENNQDDL